MSVLSHRFDLADVVLSFLGTTMNFALIFISLGTAMVGRWRRRTFGR
jgi:hypothetical protein